MNFVSDLATELALHIFSYLSAKELCRMAFICKEWAEISSDDSLWKNLCVLDFTNLEKQKNKRKCRRRKQESDQPKKNLSAYLLFCSVERPFIKKQEPSIKPTEVMRELGRKWRNLSSHMKEKYQKQALEEKIRYENEMKAYLEQKSVENICDRPYRYKNHYVKKLAEAREENEREAREKAMKPRKKQKILDFSQAILWLFGSHGDEDTDDSDNNSIMPFAFPTFIPIDDSSSDSDNDGPF